MITDEGYTLREGKEGDKPLTMFHGDVIAGPSGVSQRNIPSFVLLWDDEQIGAMQGRIEAVYFIEIFNDYKDKGHGTKFVELIEVAAKKVGHDQLVFYPVTSEILEHILQKRGYTLTVDKKVDKTYTKHL